MPDVVFNKNNAANGLKWRLICSDATAVVISKKLFARWNDICNIDCFADDMFSQELAPVKAWNHNICMIIILSALVKETVKIFVNVPYRKGAKYYMDCIMALLMLHILISIWEFLDVNITTRYLLNRFGKYIDEFLSPAYKNYEHKCLPRPFNISNSFSHSVLPVTDMFMFVTDYGIRFETCAVVRAQNI